MEESLEIEGFKFINNFDSANLAKVEKIEVNKDDYVKHENNKSQRSLIPIEIPNHEFNIWTKQDCQGTEYQNNNKTWFYFGVKSSDCGALVKFNLVNLNKQVKMFSQGMAPVFKVIPGHPQWERIKEKPSFNADEKNNEFTLSFNFRTPENCNAITYFAFTYPFSYTDLQNYLKKVDAKMSKQSIQFVDDIYYHRECAIKSIEGRRLDILTISSYYNITKEKEAKLKDLFPEEKEDRPYKFQDKKVIFLSARVHPGETPSSFVLNGFLNFLLNREDPIAITLRRLYVFKLIPMLNPDGVAQGYYRMDTRGVNLNRLYLNPSKIEHPTIFAAKTLLRYYHNSYNLPPEPVPVEVKPTKLEIIQEIIKEPVITRNIGTFDTEKTINANQSISKETNKLLQRVTSMTIEEKKKYIEKGSRMRNCLLQATENSVSNNSEFLENQSELEEKIEQIETYDETKENFENVEESGIFLYLDMHGHASKKGIFMYGNHFDDPDDSSACMLFPKLMSINNPNFHFTSCNFAEKNMYLIDKRDGMSREGSGRVAVYKLFGLIHSYTLECNYNTGRLINIVPPKVKDGVHKYKPHQVFVPPKYNPAVFEEVGAALGPSILDMTGSNPNSRIPNSQYRSLKGLQSYLKLISTNNFQSTVNKPYNKNSAGDQNQYLASDDLLEKCTKINPNTCSFNSVLKQDAKLHLSNNSCKLFTTANIYGSIKKIKSNKKPRQVVNYHPHQKPGSKAGNREAKCKKVGPNWNQLTNKPLERKKVAKGVMKKNPPKLKTIATLTKKRHNESLKKNATKVSTAGLSKKKSKSNVTVNKQSAKLESKKKSSTSKN